MSLLNKIGKIAKVTAFGVGIYAVSAFGGMTSDANASVNSQNFNETQNSSYLIESGDTLTKIANKLQSKGYNVTVESLAKDNNIKDIGKIFAGKVLRYGSGKTDSQVNEPKPERIKLTKKTTKTSLENIVQFSSDTIDDFNPRTALTNDVQANRDLVSKLSGEQYQQLRKHVKGVDLDRKLGIKRGVDSINPEMKMDNYASMYEIVEEVSQETGVSTEKIYAFMDKESNGDVWTSSGKGPRGALQLSEFMCRQNDNFKYSGPVNPFNLKESLIRAAEFIQLSQEKFSDDIAILNNFAGSYKTTKALKYARKKFDTKTPTLEQVLTFPGGEYRNNSGKKIVLKPFSEMAKAYVPAVKARESTFKKDLPQIIEIAELKYIEQPVQVAEVKFPFPREISKTVGLNPFSLSPLVRNFEDVSENESGDEFNDSNKRSNLKKSKLFARREKNVVDRNSSISQIDMREPEEVISELPDITTNPITPYGPMAESLRKKILEKKTPKYVEEVKGTVLAQNNSSKSQILESKSVQSPLSGFSEVNGQMSAKLKERLAKREAMRQARV